MHSRFSFSKLTAYIIKRHIINNPGKSVRKNRTIKTFISSYVIAEVLNASKKSNPKDDKIMPQTSSTTRLPLFSIVSFEQYVS
jgi:hypothetical protein